MQVGEHFYNRGVEYELIAVGRENILACEVREQREICFAGLEEIVYPIPTVEAVQITISQVKGGIEVLAQHIMSDGSQRDFARPRFAGRNATVIRAEVDDVLSNDVLQPILEQVKRVTS